MATYQVRIVEMKLIPKHSLVIGVGPCFNSPQIYGSVLQFCTHATRISAIADGDNRRNTAR
jgi:hypothetical protein